VTADGDVLAYERRLGGRRLLVALNLGPRPQPLRGGSGEGRILLSTALDRTGDRIIREMTLRPDEGVVVEQL
jgi:alpha-glucosidase